tara:strand:+ start:40 stop:204 length:165 start_codon:yes stop_codon:yes gene_type:complete
MSFQRLNSLQMETEDHYKKKATCYKSSPEYGKMISLYPILETSIKDCKGESLVK